MKAKGKLVSTLLVIDTFFISFALGFNSRSVLVVDPSLPPVKPAPKQEPAAAQGGATGKTPAKLTDKTPSDATNKSSADATSKTPAKPASKPASKAAKKKPAKPGHKKPAPAPAPPAKPAE